MSKFTHVENNLIHDVLACFNNSEMQKSFDREMRSRLKLKSDPLKCFAYFCKATIMHCNYLTDVNDFKRALHDLFHHYDHTFDFEVSSGMVSASSHACSSSFASTSSLPKMSFYTTPAFRKTSLVSASAPLVSASPTASAPLVSASPTASAPLVSASPTACAPLVSASPTASDPLFLASVGISSKKMKTTAVSTVSLVVSGSKTIVNRLKTFPTLTFIVKESIEYQNIFGKNICLEDENSSKKSAWNNFVSGAPPMQFVDTLDSKNPVFSYLGKFFTANLREVNNRKLEDLKDSGDDREIMEFIGLQFLIMYANAFETDKSLFTRPNAPKLWPFLSELNWNSFCSSNADEIFNF